MYRFIILPQLKRLPGQIVLYSLLLVFATVFFSLSLNLYQNSQYNIDVATDVFSTIAVPEFWTGVDHDGNAAATTDVNYAGQHAVPLDDIDIDMLRNLPGMLSVDIRRMLAAYIPDDSGRTPLEKVTYDLIRFTVKGSNSVSVKSLTRDVQLNVTDSAIGFVSYDAPLTLTHNFYQSVELQQLERFNQCGGDALLLHPGVEYVAFVEVYSQGSLLNGQVSAESLCFQNDLYGMEFYKRYISIHAEAGMNGRGYSVYNARTKEGQPFGVGRAKDLATDPKLSAYFQAVAEACKISAHSFAVTTTNLLEGIPSFHQQQHYISGGRSFTQTDYTYGAKVCIVPEELAQLKGWNIGDVISLSFYQYDGYMDVPLFSEEYREEYGWHPVYQKDNGGIFSQGDYTIVGFWSISPQNRGVSALDVRTTTIQRGMIFVPTASVENLPDSVSVTSSRLTVHLENGMMEEFLEAASKVTLSESADEVRITAFDQGYSQAQDSLQSMLGTAQFLLVLSSVLLVVAGVLLAFFYTQSQKQNMALMRLLGCSRRQAGTMAMLGSLLILLPGGILGTAAGHLLTDRVASAILNGTSSLDKPEYAGFREIFGVQAEVDFALSAQPAVSALALAVAASLFLLGCIGFTLALLRKEPREALTDR